jgi:hypothetical protein
MRRLASSALPSDAAVRTSLQLPAVDSSTVVAVTQNQTCQKALSAFNSTIPGFSPLPAKIYVVKYGTVFVAMYPTNDYARWPAAVLDSKYKVVAKFAL